MEVKYELKLMRNSPGIHPIHLSPHGASISMGEQWSGEIFPRCIPLEETQVARHSAKCLLL